MIALHCLLLLRISTPQGVMTLYLLSTCYLPKTLLVSLAIYSRLILIITDEVDIIIYISQIANYDQ